MQKSSKSIMKDLLNRIEKMLIANRSNQLSRFIKPYPENEREEDTSTWESSFISRDLMFLDDIERLGKEIIFKKGFLEAFVSFNESIGKTIDLYETPALLRSNTIHAFCDNKELTDYYIVKVDSDVYHSMTVGDIEFLEYIQGSNETGCSFWDEETSLLAMAIGAHREVTEKSRILLVSEDYDITKNDFGDEIKKLYLSDVKKMLSGIGIVDTNIELYPYDYYINNLRPGLAYDYFYRKLKELFDKYCSSVNSIGTLIEDNREELVNRYAFASNCYVGTKYESEGIKSVASYYDSLRKNSRAEIHIDDEKRLLFERLSKGASKHLQLLLDENVSRSLITSEWLFANIGKVEGFDNTFIAAGYLKTVELLLAQILVKYSNGGSYPVNDYKEMTICERNMERMMLGNMIKYIEKSDVYHAPTKSDKVSIIRMLEEWKNCVRNGYFHKHILNYNELETTRNKTFEVIYCLLSIVPS